MMVISTELKKINIPLKPVFQLREKGPLRYPKSVVYSLVSVLYFSSIPIIDPFYSSTYL